MSKQKNFSYTVVEAQARKMASAAKDGTTKIGGKTYTLTFDQKEWHYKVYDGDELLVQFNCKKLSTACAWLRYLQSAVPCYSKLQYKASSGKLQRASLLSLLPT